MRTAVFILFVLFTFATAAQQTNGRTAAAGKEPQPQLAGDTTLRMQPVPDSVWLMTDTLFGLTDVAGRALTHNRDAADTVFVYSFSRRFTEALVFNILNPERDSVTSLFAAFSVKIFYTAQHIYFVLGRGGSAVEDCCNAYIRRLNGSRRPLPDADSQKRRATFSKAALAEEAQFELFLNDTDDSQWLEAEPDIKPKRKRRELADEAIPVLRHTEYCGVRFNNRPYPLFWPYVGARKGALE
jgi:hypothetical protein